MKKNYNASVSISKYWNFIRENKIIVWAFIILLLTVKWECTNSNGHIEYNFGCSPVRISDVKDIVR
jgi:hypothetical protein